MSWILMWSGRAARWPATTLSSRSGFSWRPISTSRSMSSVVLSSIAFIVLLPFLGLVGLALFEHVGLVFRVEGQLPATAYVHGRGGGVFLGHLSAMGGACELNFVAHFHLVVAGYLLHLQRDHHFAFFAGIDHRHGVFADGSG